MYSMSASKSTRDYIDAVGIMLNIIYPDEMRRVGKRHKAMSAVQTRECGVSISILVIDTIIQIATSVAYSRSIDAGVSLAPSAFSVSF
jgi:hypothetical protein